MDLSPMSNTNLQGGKRNESGNNSSVALSIGDLSAQIVRKRSIISGWIFGRLYRSFEENIGKL